MNKYEEQPTLNKYEQMLASLKLKNIFTNLNEIIPVAEELVKRATPMEVLVEQEYFMDYDNGVNIDNQPSISQEVWRCPVCRNRLWTEPSYCPVCGQALDWSDVK